MTPRRLPLARAALPVVTSLAMLALARCAGAQAAPGGTASVDTKAFKVDEPGTFVTADLSYVLTSGNARTSTLGFKGDLIRRWTRHALSFGAGGIQSSSSSGLNYAQGTPTSFEIIRPEPKTTAEYYNVRARYDYKITERFFYMLGANWERNLFSGIRSRTIGETGFGYVFAASEQTDFRSRVGVTYTSTNPVVNNPDVENEFAGARFGWSLRQRVTANTTFTHDLVLDENLKSTDDFRADAGFGLNVAMSSILALKANYRLLYAHLPALETVPLRDPSGTPIGVVTSPLKTLDTGLSLSLVLNWSKKATG